MSACNDSFYSFNFEGLFNVHSGTVVCCLVLMDMMLKPLLIQHVTPFMYQCSGAVSLLIVAYLLENDYSCTDS